MSDIPGTISDLNLGEILQIQEDASKTSLDVNLPLMQLIDSSIQLASINSGIVADVGIPLGIAGATVKAKITEPAQTAIGNPDLAELDPYGNNAIYAHTSQVRTFVSLDLPIVGTALNNLSALLTAPLVADVSNVVNSLLTLDLIDIAISAGNGDARVKDADCDIDGNKNLNAEVSTSVTSVALGQFGSSAENAATNFFSDDELDIQPIPLIDIGSIRVKKTCVIIVGCSYQYQKGAGWTSDKTLADRQAFVGGGIGLKLDTSILGDGPENLSTFVNSPDDTYLPNVKDDIENSYQSFSADDPVASLASTLLGVELEFYQPSNGNLLGGVLSLVGGTANTLVSSINSIFATALSPILDPLVNSLLNTLGVSLANAEVGAALTCENDKVRLTN